MQTDPTALYSYEEYEAGADTVNLVDASEIDISVMGEMDMAGGVKRNSQRAKDGR